MSRAERRSTWFILLQNSCCVALHVCVSGSLAGLCLPSAPDHWIWVIVLIKPGLRAKHPSYLSHVKKTNQWAEQLRWLVYTVVCPEQQFRYRFEDRSILFIKVRVFFFLQVLPCLRPEDVGLFPADWSFSWGHSCSWEPLCRALPSAPGSQRSRRVERWERLRSDALNLHVNILVYTWFRGRIFSPWHGTSVLYV